jgi:hypothetical protein
MRRYFADRKAKKAATSASVPATIAPSDPDSAV